MKYILQRGDLYIYPINLSQKTTKVYPGFNVQNAGETEEIPAKRLLEGWKGKDRG